MGYEPNAQKRLQLLWATTADATLRHELGTALTASEDHGMSFVPSADLVHLIQSCATCDPARPIIGRDGLCETHRARWNLEVCTAEAFGDRAEETLDRIMRGVLSTESGGRVLLAAFERQLRALNMVWEAHERGVVRLPDRVAESVRQARSNIPSAIPGSTQSVIKQAS